jgi:hypothetical protein
MNIVFDLADHSRRHISYQIMHIAQIAPFAISYEWRVGDNFVRPQAFVCMIFETKIRIA